MSLEHASVADSNGEDSNFVANRPDSYSALQRIQVAVSDLVAKHAFTSDQSSDISELAIDAARLGAQHPDMNLPYTVVGTIERSEAREVVSDLINTIKGVKNE